MDLNFDCQLLIIEKMRMEDLFAMSETCKHLLFVVETALRTKFVKYAVSFRTPYEYDSLYNQFELYKGRITPRTFKYAQKMFKYFGHLIPKIEIFHEAVLTFEGARKIFHPLNLYCAETLKELHINSKNEPFYHFDKPFKTVEKLSLGGSFNDMGNSIFTFAQLFPSITHLDLNSIRFENESWIDQQHPHLVDLKASIAIWHKSSTYSGQQLDEDYFKRLIRSNLQIRSLTMRCLVPDTLQFVAETLPHLQNLEICSYAEDYKAEDRQLSFNFTFPNVRRFTVVGSTNKLPSNITFSSIEELHMDSYLKNKFTVIEFMRRHQRTLRKFSWTVHLNNQDLSNLANAELDLVEMKLQIDREVTFQQINILIENSNQLKKLTLHIIYEDFCETLFDELKQSVQNKWKINKAEKYIFFENMEF